MVGPDSVTRADIGILDGLIAEVGAELAGGAATEIDATGLHVFPGVVDPHVHFNDPGRADWEGFDDRHRGRSPPVAARASSTCR